MLQEFERKISLICDMEGDPLIRVGTIAVSFSYRMIMLEFVVPRIHVAQAEHSKR